MNENTFDLTTKSVVKQSDLVDNLKPYMEKINEFSKSFPQLRIEADEDLPMYEHKIKNIKTLEKEVLSIKQVLADPLKEDIKTINEGFKLPLSILEDLKKKGNKKILDYRTLKEAMLKAEQERKLKEIEDKAKEKENNLLRLEAINKRIKAYMFGGEYPDRNGEVKSAPGCSNIKDCEKIISIIERNFPNPEDFKEFEHDANVLKQEALSKLNNLSQIFMMIESFDSDTKEEGIKQLSSLRIKYEEDQRVSTSKIRKEIETSVNKEIKEIDKEIKSAKKNIRRDVRFKVTDISIVPSQFLSVDKKLVNNYLVEYRDKIKENISFKKETENPTIPGILFYYEETNVSR